MEIKVIFLDKLRFEAKFDAFTVVADQPIMARRAQSLRLLPGLIGFVCGLLCEVVLRNAQHSNLVENLYGGFSQLGL